MRTCTMKLKSASAYSQSRAHEEPKLAKEQHDAYDLRTWRSKAHTDAAGNVVIPAAAIMSAIQDSAQMLGLRIPGKGTATYTKHFERGLLILDDIPIGVRADKLACERIYCHADGKRGSGKRVWRRFPVIPEWSATVEVTLLDSAITEEVFERVAREAGQFIGIGRFRPQNRGSKGRFIVKSFAWSGSVPEAA